jgi:hypothetical protein
MSDFTITKEQLRSLTDPKVKEMFPDAFENILEEGNWYKSGYGGAIAFCKKIEHGAKEDTFFGHSVWIDDSFEDTMEFRTYMDWQPATQEEVFDALKRAAIKMGYKKGLYCFFGIHKKIRDIEEDGFKMSTYVSNALVLGYDQIFVDGEWAEIVNKNLL